MFALADPSTTRVLRALSIGGAATVLELAARLALPPESVRAIVRRSLALGVIRPLPGGVARYEVVREAVAAAVAQHRENLLGATA